MPVYRLAPFKEIAEKLDIKIVETDIPKILRCTDWNIPALVQFDGEPAQIVCDDDFNYEKPHNAGASILIEQVLFAPWDIRGDALILTAPDMLL